MKAGWQEKPLGEVAQVIAGQSPKGSAYNSSGSGVPFYQGKKEFGERFIGEPTTWTTQTTKLAVGGDVLMSVRAPVGPVNFATEECCIGRGLAAIRSQNGLNKDFLFYFFLWKQDEISGKAGAVFPSISKTEIEQIRIPYPPQEEQQRIVAILDKAFAAIATAKDNTEKNLLNARALFESRLREQFSVAWRHSQIVPLSDLATDITDGDHLPPPKAREGVPFITISNIVKETRQIDFTDTFRVPPSYFAALKDNRKPSRGDVLYTVTGSFGIPVLVNNGSQFCFQRHIALLRPKPDVASRWLYYLMLSPQVFRQADEGATGAAQRTVSLKLLRNFRVPKAPTILQNEMVASLDFMQRKTEALANGYVKELSRLGELRQAILDRALSGQLT